MLFIFIFIQKSIDTSVTIDCEINESRVAIPISCSVVDIFFFLISAQVRIYTVIQIIWIFSGEFIQFIQIDVSFGRLSQVFCIFVCNLLDHITCSFVLNEWQQLIRNIDTVFQLHSKTDWVIALQWCIAVLQNLER